MNTQNNFASEKEATKTKINVFSKKALKVVDVLRTICMVCMIIIGVTSLIILGVAVSNSFTDWLTNWIISHPEAVDEIRIDSGAFGFIKIVDGIPLQELVGDGRFDNYLYELFFKVSFVAVDVVIVYFLLIIFKKLFTKLENVTSPFSTDLLVTVRTTFIVTAIIVVINDFFAGVIVALVLACFFYIYKYGCKLQEESDETI